VFLIPAASSQLGSQLEHLPSVSKLSHAFEEKLDKAVEQTISHFESIHKQMRRQQASMDESESDDSDDDGFGTISNQRVNGVLILDDDALDPGIVNFIKALPFCVPLYAGFHTINVFANSDECCYCPCARQLKRWRAKHNLHGITECDRGGSSRPKGVYKPQALMAHLEVKSGRSNGSNQLESCHFHSIVWYFMWKVYEDHWAPGIHHKGLYKGNDEGFRKAEARENQKTQRYVRSC